MAKSMEELMELIDKIPNEPAKVGEFILPELMAIAIANEVRNDRCRLCRHWASHGGYYDRQLYQCPECHLDL